MGLWLQASSCVALTSVDGMVFTQNKYFFLSIFVSLLTKRMTERINACRWSGLNSYEGKRKILTHQSVWPNNNHQQHHRWMMDATENILTIINRKCEE